MLQLGRMSGGRTSGGRLSVYSWLPHTLLSQVSAILRLAGLNLCAQSLWAPRLLLLPLSIYQQGKATQVTATTVPYLGAKWVVGLGLALFSNDVSEGAPGCCKPPSSGQLLGITVVPRLQAVLLYCAFCS